MHSHNTYSRKKRGFSCFNWNKQKKTNRNNYKLMKPLSVEIKGCLVYIKLYIYTDISPHTYRFPNIKSFKKFIHNYHDF